MLNIDHKETKLLIFDFDGTLVDTETAHYKGFYQVLDEVGIKYLSQEDHIKTYSGKPAKYILGGELEKAGKSLDILEQLIERKKEIYKKLVARNEVTLIPGGIEILEEAKNKGFKLALISGGLPEGIYNVIEILKIPNCFEIFITGVDGFKPKPDPEAYLHTAKELNVDPSECIVFEDAINGIESTLNAGMKPVALTTYTSEEKFKELYPEILTIRDFNDISLS